MSTAGKRRPMRGADHVVTFIGRLSENSAGVRVYLGLNRDRFTFFKIMLRYFSHV